MHQEKKLSALLESANRGHTLIIAQTGKPVAELVPLKKSKERKMSLWKDEKFRDDAFLEHKLTEIR